MVTIGDDLWLHHRHLDLVDIVEKFGEGDGSDDHSPISISEKAVRIYSELEFRRDCSWLTSANRQPR